MRHRRDRQRHDLHNFLLQTAAASCFVAAGKNKTAGIDEKPRFATKKSPSSIAACEKCGKKGIAMLQIQGFFNNI